MKLELVQVKITPKQKEKLEELTGEFATQKNVFINGMTVLFWLLRTKEQGEEIFTKDKEGNVTKVEFLLNN